MNHSPQGVIHFVFSATLLLSLYTYERYITVTEAAGQKGVLCLGHNYSFSTASVKLDIVGTSHQFSCTGACSLSDVSPVPVSIVSLFLDFSPVLLHS
jgi:hypothetical protein